jgi:hypothetical protein
VQVTIEPRAGYLKVTVRRRETVEEVKAAIPDIVDAARKHKRSRILIVAEESNPIFRVQQYDLPGWLDRFAEIADLRIALVSDTAELFASHQYIELLAGQRGVPIRAFREEKPAVEWLLA